MKNKFINDLKDKSVSSADNEKQLEELRLGGQTEHKKEDFKTSISDKRHKWGESYFNEKLVFLGLYDKMDEDLAEHLIEVKKYIESKNPASTQKVEKELSVPEKNEAFLEGDSEQQNKVKMMENPLKEKPKSQVNLDGYKPSDNLEKLLSANDLRGIHNYLMLILNNRRLDLEFVIKEIHYVWQNKESVFQEEEDSAFIQAIDKDEKNWNMNYFTSQQVYLNRNFSLVRLLHLLNVREFLMKKGDPNFQQIKTENTQKTQANNNSQSTQSSEQSTFQASGNQHYRETQDKTTQSGDRSSQSEKESNGFLKTAALVGGAILALVVVLFAMGK